MSYILTPVQTRVLFRSESPMAHQSAWGTATTVYAYRYSPCHMYESLFLI
jgi:hypothetical protein